MKILIKLALLAAVLTANLAAQAGTVRGYFRSNGTSVAPHFRSSYGPSIGGSGSSSRYVYRNPYAAYPSVSVRAHHRSTGIYVPSHDRTPANNTPTDNLSYRGFGTIRVPRY